MRVSRRPRPLLSALMRSRAEDWPTAGPGQVVADSDDERAVLDTHVDVDPSAGRAGFDPVPDRVFDQWLDRQRRHDDIGNRIGQAPVHAQAWAETQRFDFQVTPGERKFVGDRDVAGSRQRRAEQVGEVQQQVLGVGGPGMDECGAGVERIE